MAQNGDRARGRKHDRPPAKTLYAAREGAGSLRGAARVLGVPPSTASRWYRELEREGPKPATKTRTEPEAPDWSDPAAVRAWRLERWRLIALGDGAAALTALDRLGAAAGVTEGAVDPGALSHADADALREVRKRWAQWQGARIQARIKRHETNPSDDPIARDRDARLAEQFVLVATLSPAADREALIEILQEYGEDL